MFIWIIAAEQDTLRTNKLLQFEPVIPKAHEEKFADSIRRILGSFYNLDTPYLSRQWTERPVTTLYHSSYEEDFMRIYDAADIPGADGLINWTAATKNNAGVEAWDRSKTVYPTELYNLVVNRFKHE